MIYIGKVLQPREFGQGCLLVQGTNDSSQPPYSWLGSKEWENPFSKSFSAIYLNVYFNIVHQSQFITYPSSDPIFSTLDLL